MSVARATAMTMVLAACFVGITTATTMAQERMGDARVQVITKADVVRLDDAEGHTIGMFESKGYNLKTGSWTLNRGTNDLIKGNGSGQGYTTTYYPDGAITYSSWEGKTTMSVVDGKSISTSAGTWKLISGTGEWKNREASGTWKTRPVGDGVSFVEWEGEWRPKR